MAIRNPSLTLSCCHQLLYDQEFSVALHSVSSIHQWQEEAHMMLRSVSWCWFNPIHYQITWCLKDQTILHTGISMVVASGKVGTEEEEALKVVCKACPFVFLVIAHGFITWHPHYWLITLRRNFRFDCHLAQNCHYHTIIFYEKPTDHNYVLDCTLEPWLVQQLM